MFCKNCGKEIDDKAVVCIYCGCAVEENRNLKNTSSKSWLTTLLLCLFLGGLGVHRFYTGHTGSGVAQLLTMGGCGIWAFVDFIMIICGSFKTADGTALEK